MRSGEQRYVLHITKSFQRYGLILKLYILYVAMYVSPQYVKSLFLLFSFCVILSRTVVFLFSPSAFLSLLLKIFLFHS